MPSTPRTSTPYPAPGDSPDGAAQMQALAETLEKYGIPRFASSAARDSAITAPTEGDFCYRTDIDRIEMYEGTAWMIVQELGGSWTSYTPTLANITLGSGGSTVGRWRRWGMDVEFEVVATFGTSGIAMGTGPTCSLPVSMAADQANFLTGTSALFDATGPLYLAPTVAATATTAEPRIPGTSGALAQVTSTTPFTWAINDRVYFKGRYRAASRT